MQKFTTRFFGFSLLAVLVASLAGVLCAESFLRWQRPHYFYKAKDFVGINSGAYFIRPAYAVVKHPHPDKNEWVPVRYDQNGLRMSSGPSAYSFSQSWGFFGSSYVENIRLDEADIFTTPLSLALQRKNKGVLNFGVEGHGPDQSYLDYLGFADINRLEKVFYIFSHRDLVKLLEGRIFDIQGRELVPKTHLQVPLWKRFVAQSYLTHFIFDEFGYLIKQKEKTEKTKVGLKEIKLLKLIFKNWREEVERRGGEFKVVVLPDRRSHELAQSLKLLNDKWFFTRDYFFKNGDLEKAWTFKNDEHWNELAQQKFAKYLLKNFKP